MSFKRGITSNVDRQSACSACGDHHQNHYQNQKQQMHCNSGLAPKQENSLEVGQFNESLVCCCSNHNGFDRFGQLAGDSYRQAPSRAASLAPMATARCSWSSEDPQADALLGIRATHIPWPLGGESFASGDRQTETPFEHSVGAYCEVPLGSCLSQPPPATAPFHLVQRTQDLEKNNNPNVLQLVISLGQAPEQDEATDEEKRNCNTTAPGAGSRTNRSSYLTQILLPEPGDASTSSHLSKANRATTGDALECQQQAGANGVNQVSGKKSIEPQEREELKEVELLGQRIWGYLVNGQEWLCSDQISRTLLEEFSTQDIRNRKSVLKISGIPCTSAKTKALYNMGAIPSFNYRYGLISRADAERLCRSFLIRNRPKFSPALMLPLRHRVYWGCKGRCVPSSYKTRQSKCIKCSQCGESFSPNQFIQHSHRSQFMSDQDYHAPRTDRSKNWRTALELDDDLGEKPTEEMRRAWEDVKYLFEDMAHKLRSQET